MPSRGIDPGTFNWNPQKYGPQIRPNGVRWVTTVMRLRGAVETAVTAGDLQFQFANNGAGSGRTTSVKTNSFLKIGKF